MQLALAPRSGDAPDPILQTAEILAGMLAAGRPPGRETLRTLMSEATGLSDADGGWTLRDAYDALELAQVLLATGSFTPLDERQPAETLERLESLAGSLPTQTHRGEEQIALQAFSTPLPLAWLVGLAGHPSSNDLLLEPSAGTGLLAFLAARAGARLHLNEIDPGRRRCLAAAYPRAAVTGHDGELIHDLLDPDIRPTLVLMNPPFARGFGRGEDRYAAARHLLGSLTRLAPGGRLVAIMPESFCESGSGKALRARADRVATPRLDALLARGLFAKHGTGIAVRFVVYDKMRDARAPTRAQADRLGQLLSLVEALPARGTPLLKPLAPRIPNLSLFARRPASSMPASPARATGAGRACEPLVYRSLDHPAPVAEQVGLYLPYRPSRVAIPGASAHPTPLVESLAMGSIAAPRPTHAPTLPAGLVASGGLSEAQLETLIYAGSAFERDLPGLFLPAREGCAMAADEAGAPYRCGYFLGDGTGAGKGRQVAGIILDQWLRGNGRHIWLSKNETLLEDARRDWSALGGLPLDIQPLSQWKLGAPIAMDRGILFVTYPTLRSGRADATRLRQLLDWATAEFDGVIAFDEAHAMANAAGGEGSRGKVKGSEQGVAGVRLQNLLPRARILYASATGASDVNNLAYAMRLGLWGPETAFADRTAFVAAIRDGGIAAMELVARDLKALGLYTARALSFAGVEYDVLEHELTGEQTAIYDAYADAWAIIHANLSTALEATRVVDDATGATLNANAKSAALSRFEGCKQRFFGQLLLSMKLPSLVPAIGADLAAGQAVVVQLVSTAEAMLDRRLAELSPAEREALEIDLSPREYVIDYLSAAFPTRQMRVFTDDEGNVRSEPLSDEEGRPVHSQEALRARDDLIEQLCALPAIGTALDTLIERFGTDALAEVTGRTRRLVVGADGRQKIENRTGRSNLVETDAFMRGDKSILIFSDAGGTGRSYHACLGAKNQSRRIHYLLEPGWRADAAIQGLGRTHRTRQASAPLFRPVTTDVRGERRFISTIARRLDSLGALTRGQRQTGGQNLFDPADNLESRYAKDALTSWYHLLAAGKLGSVTLGQFQSLTGLKLEGEDGALREDLPPIQRWLNRLLALRIALQNSIFDEFLGLVEARVAAAREAGTLDLGVETVPVDSFEILEDRIIRTDPRSGATTHLLRIELARRLRPMSLEWLRELSASRPDAVPMLNARSGKVALRVRARSLMSEEGVPIARFELIRPLKREYLPCDRLDETSWEAAPREAFECVWQAEVRQAEETLRRETLHLATGLLLPVWDKLPDDHVQVMRIAAADGRSLLGREIPAAALGELGTKLGLDIPLDVPPDELAATVLRSGRSLPVRGVEDLVLKRALVNGSQRLELTGFSAARLPWYKSHGCFTEIVRYQTRLFVPADRAAQVLERLIRKT
ncbi:MAG: strawberry notch-like NTP hydrolase domain-containing protein [Sphingosinicella sp.]|uniref:strawberry notch-like NTP hydrolase domain-containing protein n=1 Tax=Sphingosinicella sp. TaxID=1917971 RepID=UPI004037B867